MNESGPYPFNPNAGIVTPTTPGGDLDTKIAESDPQRGTREAVTEKVWVEVVRVWKELASRHADGKISGDQFREQFMDKFNRYAKDHGLKQ